MNDSLSDDFQQFMSLVISMCNRMGVKFQDCTSYKELWEEVVKRLKPTTVNKLIQLMIEEEYDLSDDFFGSMYEKLTERSKTIH